MSITCPYWQAGSGELSIAPGALSETAVEQSEEAGTGKEREDKDKGADKSAKTEEKDKKSLPLLPTSEILRLLAEMVRSYAGCAGLITQHVYQAGQTEHITEVGWQGISHEYS